MKLIDIIRIFLLVVFSLGTRNSTLMAQLVPDDTLGTESSKINSIDELRDRIEGGASKGTNLFHSFQEFSVNEGLSVDFVNPDGIVNIFTRVTGSNVSEIFGTLGVDGNANLFLINPNGIVFGENSAIDVGGSFLATTANTIDFSDGSKFSAHEPGNPLLTIEIPVGLGFGSKPESIKNSGIIRVNGTGHNVNALGGNSATRGETNSSLTALPSQTLALVGKEVIVDGGVLLAPSGNIEIASVHQGEVGIANFSEDGEPLSLKYDDVEVFGDVTFANRSLLDVSSTPNSPQLSGGNVKVQGSNILSTDGSVILNQNFGENNSGTVSIVASETFQVSGTDPVARILGGIRTETLSKGNGASIKISTPKFSIIEGGSIQALTYSPFVESASGDISVNVSDLQILGSSPRTAFSFSNITTFTFGRSNAGNLSINSDTLVLRDGGVLGSSGILGSVGNIKINAAKYIEITGFQPTVLIPSNIISTNTSSLAPGSINITTPNLYIRDGANISTSTFGGGSAGSIFIDVNNLEITGKVPLLQLFQGVENG